MKGAHEKKKHPHGRHVSKKGALNFAAVKNHGMPSKNKHHLTKVSSQGETIKFKVFN
jgi:hypothetical protein